VAAAGRTSRRIRDRCAAAAPTCHLLKQAVAYPFAKKDVARGPFLGTSPSSPGSVERDSVHCASAANEELHPFCRERV
jgi:hypothetical protein